MAKKTSRKKASRKKAPVSSGADAARSDERSTEPEVRQPEPAAPEAPEPSSSQESAESSREAEPEAGPEPDPAEQARLTRLARARVPIAECPVLGLPLDPSSAPTQTPALCRGTWMSDLARRLLRAQVTPEQLERAAAWLRERKGA